jgi:lysophospholipase L1-like esterase
VKLLIVVALATTAMTAPAEQWVGSWSVAVTPPSTSGLSAIGVTDATFRQVAHLSVGGAAVRLRLSNRYGEKPLVVGRVTVAPGTSGKPTVDPARLVPVTFAGKTSTTIPIGSAWVSDPIRIKVPNDSDLVISTYLPGPTGPLTQHPRGYATTFLASGDKTRDGGSAYKKAGAARYVIAGVDVLSRATGSIVLFGDSITDGVVSPVDGNLRYPDQLADRLKHRQGALNAGISGNRLLVDAGPAGESAMARFDRDVLGQTKVRTVVLLEGINDIGTNRGSLEPEQLIAVHREFIERAHEAGLRVFGATLTPFEGSGYYTVAGEEDRQALNRWIRTSGEYDGVVDFDAAVRDPKNPRRLLGIFDWGDHLHPNAAGFQAMAEAFDLDQLVG